MRTSWFGTAAIVPRTTSGSTRSCRVTLPTSATMVGTSAAAPSSSAVFAQPGVKTSAPAASRPSAARQPGRESAGAGPEPCRRLCNRSTDDLLQIREGRLEVEQRLQVVAPDVAQAALRVEQREQRVASRL